MPQRLVAATLCYAVVAFGVAFLTGFDPTQIENILLTAAFIAGPGIVASTVLSLASTGSRRRQRTVFALAAGLWLPAIGVCVLGVVTGGGPRELGWLLRGSLLVVATLSAALMNLCTYAARLATEALD